MNAPPDKWTFSALDEILLDLAALIELSPQDRRITENRYRLLKTHIERPSSPLRPYMVDRESKIFAQGSVATSTTIVTGDGDDRFDLDAIVEADIPPSWSDREALDKLEEALQGFPGVKKIVRCTRCVQLQFATMHMDVTLMDRRGRIAGARPGDIFHSPDKGRSYRVPSNPWGFTGWFRSVVKPGSREFTERLTEVRKSAALSRIPFLDDGERTTLAKADQVPLPPAIPSHLDAIEAVALKLLKRFLNLRYATSPLNALSPAFKHITEGRLRALAVTSKTRYHQLPDVPTMIEAGRPDIVGDLWVGMLAPGKTPDDVVKLLNSEIRIALQAPELRAKLQGVGFDTVGTSPDEFATQIAKESAVWGKIIREAKIEASP